MTRIGRSAFYGTAWENNKPYGLIYAGKVAYKYEGHMPANVTIKDGTLAISSSAFHRDSGLTSVTIPSSVISIDESAFNWCENLTTAYVANSNTQIAPNAFDHPSKDFRIVYGEPEKPLLAQTTTKPIAEKTTAQHTPKTSPKPTPKPQTKTTQKSQVSAKPKEQTTTAQKPLVAAVDKNIPMAGMQDRNTFAVVIGNEKYDNEAPVPFAENDARVFKEYLQKTLGVPEKQIRFIPNATLNNLRIAVRWLKQAMEVCGGTGKAIFYYAGHGIPDEADKTAYLLPTDGIGGDAETAYSLQKLYAELSKMTAQRTVVFLDACFSGAKREGDMMASARGVAIKVKASEPQGNMVVFTAAQGDETAYPYNSQQHGMFTYFLLKKMQDTKGDVSLGELGDYLTQEVKRESFVENNKMQTPSVNASSALANSWRSIKLR